MAKLILPNSEIKGLRIIVVDPDEERGFLSQSILEEDLDLNRALVFFISTISEAKSLLINQKIQLAIFPHLVDQKDFVSIQQEFLKISPDIQMIPLIATPTIKQLRESRALGGILDYGEVGFLNDPKSLKQLIFSFIRASTIQNAPLKAALDYAKPLQRALNISDLRSQSIKSKSSKVLAGMLGFYEIDYNDVPALLAAECVYGPSMSISQYKTLLTPDPQSLLPILNATGSKKDHRQPTTLAGFLVTASNFLAEKIDLGLDTNEIILELQTRPDFLKYVAIKVLTEDVVKSICTSLSSKNAKLG